MEKDFEEIQRIERLVIGEILVGGSETYEAAAGAGIRNDSFTDGKSMVMWECMVQASGDGLQIDLVSLIPYAKRSGITAAELASFTTGVASVRNVESHCALLNAFRLERKADECGLRIISLAHAKDKNNVISEIEDAVREYREQTTKTRIRHISGIANDAGMEMRKRVDMFYSGELSGIPTGFKSLNIRMNGWQKGTLNIIAARPAMGKTAFAVHFAIEAAKKGYSVCMFAMEMRAERIVDRMALSITNLNGDKFRRGELTASDIEEYNSASAQLSRLPIYIDDNSNCTTSYIQSSAKRMHEDGKCDMVVIDYLQLTDMASGSSKSYTRENMVTAASRAFKVLAKELDIPVLLLSQLNRAAESRADRKPMLSDLRESGSIEQDADTVLLLHRPEYYDPTSGVMNDADGNFMYGIGTMNLAKQREGGVGEMEFNYDRTLSKIWD